MSPSAEICSDFDRKLICSQAIFFCVFVAVMFVYVLLNYFIR
jgi:hypothetical protein